MPSPDNAPPPSLSEALRAAASLGGFHGSRGSVGMAALLAGSSIATGDLRGRSVLLRTRDQLRAALALVALDGSARRVVLCPPELDGDQVVAVMRSAEIEVVVCDVADAGSAVYGGCRTMPAAEQIVAGEPDAGRGAPAVTEWLLLTSGTTGAQKLAQHTLASLTGAIRRPASPPPGGVVWATFYDIRRYGGLQIYLRAVLGGASLVLSSAGEPVAEHVARLAAAGVTHISGTPSHWRRLLMSGQASGFRPRYVRLSGEIADQAVLDALAQAFPGASVGHAYASTEAGVAFEVNDGREGFPATYVGQADGEVAMAVVDGSLRVRSTRIATRFVGRDDPVAEADGFVDTGDMVELRGDRWHFTGRRGGIINVGGNKVHPEEVEGVVNRHPAVRMSLARAKRNPISGAVVVADVVLREPAASGAELVPADVEREILDLCRTSLARHKVPALIRFVPSIGVSPAGKIARHA